MILTLILLYAVLVTIAFGMTLHDDELFANDKQRFKFSALLLWFLVPFLTLIVFGRALTWLNTYFKRH